MVAVDGVRVGECKRSACGRPHDAVEIADGVGARSAHERGVNVQFAHLDGAHAASVGADGDGPFHEAVGDGVAELPADAAALDAGDDALFDEVDQHVVVTGEE